MPHRRASRRHPRGDRYWRRACRRRRPDRWSAPVRCGSRWSQSTDEPSARHSARVTACAGTRTPTRPVPPLTPGGQRPRGAATSSVNGPGQKRSRQPLRRAAAAAPSCARTWSTSAATSGSALIGGRASLSRRNTRATASGIERIDGEAIQRVGGQRNQAARVISRPRRALDERAIGGQRDRPSECGSELDFHVRPTRRRECCR